MQNNSHFPVIPEEKGGFPLDSALRWTLLPEMPKAEGVEEEQIFDEEHRLTPIHPIYVIPWDRAEQMHMFFTQKEGF